ncbi:Type IV pilus biogenesis [Roseovarius azorensis]|uniref:Type IV pilus biogenesis n=1 Tax=Roseovarius azorensis TaxID=1287727 RepID=A0A1H7VJN5_9RHOB|nr:type II secretion system protein N [Roseovarius azorensis]SEM09018.1 Type IV pilus biogenesis [Roseovarius azorensis]
MTDTTKTPDATLDAATTRNALPDARLTLVGTMHGPERARALVRRGHDRYTTVSVGDPISGATVAAIGEGVIVLSRGGRTERLSLPAA